MNKLVIYFIEIINHNKLSNLYYFLFILLNALYYCFPLHPPFEAEI